MLVAVVESLVEVSGEVELYFAVDASEVLLIGVKVDTLAAKEVKLGLVVHSFVKRELSVLDPDLLGISCLLGLGASCLLGLGASCLLGLGGSSLLLLLDSGWHDSSLLSDRVRMDVPHEVPRLNRSFSGLRLLRSDRDHALFGADDTDIAIARAGIFDRLEGLVDERSEHRVVLHQTDDLVEGKLDELASDLGCELSANNLLHGATEQETELALVLVC